MESIITLNTNSKEVFDWMIAESNEVGGDPDICFGFNVNGVLSAGIFLDKDSYNRVWINLVSKDLRWWNKKNLSFIVDVCYKELNCTTIVALSSRNNHKINKILDLLGFKNTREEESFNGDIKMFWKLRKNKMLKQNWYKGVYKNGNESKTS